MDGMIDLDDIHLELNDEYYAQKYNFGYVAQLNTEVAQHDDATLFNICLRRRDAVEFVTITMDTHMVEQLCANLNLFLLAEMMR